MRGGMSRYDLTDFRMARDRAVAAEQAEGGAKRVDDRRVLNGIFWVLRSGAPWRDLPERYGPRTTSLQSLRALAKARACGIG